MDGTTVSRAPRIAVLASWYPTVHEPHAGTFVREQMRAVKRSEPDIDIELFHARSVGVTREAPRSLRALSTLAPRHWYTQRDPCGYVEHLTEALLLPPWLGMEVSLVHLAARTIAEVVKAHRRQPFDVLHAHVSHPSGVIARQASRILGLPYVLTEHMSPFPFPAFGDSRGRPKSTLVKVFRDARRVIAVSPSARKEILELTGVDAMVIPNVTDERMFTPAMGGRAPGPFRFTSVGALVRQKGFDVLLEATRAIIDRGVAVSLRVVGEGPDHEALETLASRLGIEAFVSFEGAMPRERVAEVLRTSDGFVLASRHESFGVVIIEALATGLPVIATRCGGPEGIVRTEDGILVPVEDPAALSNAMEAMARGEHTFETATIRRGFEERYASSVVAASLRAVYEDVVRAGKLRARGRVR